MKINEVKDLMKTFEDSNIREFSWTNETDSLQLSKNQGASSVQTVPAAAQSSSFAEQIETIIPEKAETVNESESGNEEVGEAVKSPLVGVVYLKPAPDKADFIAIGDQVKKGQTLLIIEAMKVMNEIPAPEDGVIVDILVDADQVVEYGQELVRIK